MRVVSNVIWPFYIFLSSTCFIGGWELFESWFLYAIYVTSSKVHKDTFKISTFVLWVRLLHVMPHGGKLFIQRPHDFECLLLPKLLALWIPLKSPAGLWGNYQNTIFKEQQFIFLLRTTEICPSFVETFLTVDLFPMNQHILASLSSLKSPTHFYVVNDCNDWQGKTQKMGSISYVVVIFHVVTL